MTLQGLNESFVYMTDKEQYKVMEEWRELELSEDGNRYGDCEDYALTVKNQVVSDEYDFSTWDLYWCRLNGDGHCVLSNGYLVIDNNVKKVLTLDRYFQVFKVTEFRKFSLFEKFGKYILRYLVNPIVRLIG